MNTITVDTLGYFSLFTNLSYALGLPFWGWLLHRYTVKHAHNILAFSCILWGVATLSIAHSETILSQGFFRSVNGGALASILPLSQMMLADQVPSSMHGSAFGLMGLLEKAAATIATSAVVWYDDWRIPYIFIGCVSVLIAFAAKRYTQMKSKKQKEDQNLSFIGILRRISKIPTFVYLVAQGLFGAIPWDAMSFVFLLLEWKDFTKEQIISYQFIGGICGTMGAFIGGVLGDYFANFPGGRMAVAMFAIIVGNIFYALFLFSEVYHVSIFWYSMFHLVAGWCPAAACRPICIDLARNQIERAQIVAAWVLLEKISSSIFGAPLVGFLTKRLFDENLVSTNIEKSRVLARNMFLLSTVFWGMCAYFWSKMIRIERRQKAQSSSEEEHSRSHGHIL